MEVVGGISEGQQTAQSKLQALTYYLLPPTTAITGYAVACLVVGIFCSFLSDELQHSGVFSTGREVGGHKTVSGYW